MSTGRIQLLSPKVRERIAAGEVIERPASVVKELVENSLDAGATEVLVSLEDGGRGLIEVLDNGHGMGPGDLETSILRHATSKIREFEDLDRLATLGFRGEALPSIAAVADLSILSQEKAGTAHELRLECGETADSARVEETTFGHFQGSMHGTRVQVRGLFSRIPARLKFLKSPAAEVAQVREWLERLALTHPQVGFRLTSNQRTLFALRPQSESERVRAILSDGNDYPVISVSNDLGLPLSDGPRIRVRAHWLQGLSSPQARRVIQVVNHRAVRDRMLQQAVMSPFRQALLPGQFPAVALYLEIPASEIDVNAHPTKTEIRFVNGREAFRAVESLVSSMLASHGNAGFVAGGPSASSPELPASGPSPRPSWSGYSGTPAASSASRSSEGWSFQELSQLSSREEQTSLSLSATAETASAHPFQAGKYLGTLFQTYLLYELSSEMLLIDQHAAHERIRYEALKERALGSRKDGASKTSQELLLPEVVVFRAEMRPQIEQGLSVLSALGFEAELFGEDRVVFRAIPGEWGGNDLRSRLGSLIEKLTELDLEPGRTDQGQMLLDESLFEKLASQACHSAIRAGDRLEPQEAEALLEQLFACEHPWNCPHGRPTTVRMPEARFEEWFQRRV